MTSLPAPIKDYTYPGNSIAVPKYYMETHENQRRAHLFLRDVSGAAAGSTRVTQLLTGTDPSFLNKLRGAVGILSGGSDEKVNPAGTLGYIDFLLMQAEMNSSEKLNLLKLSGDQYITHFTGREPSIFSYGGVLINAENANHLQHFIVLYNIFLRASRTSQYGLSISLNYDDFKVLGQMISLSSGIRGEQQVAGSFSFQILVKKLTLKMQTGGDNLFSGVPVQAGSISAATVMNNPGSSKGVDGDDIGVTA